MSLRTAETATPEAIQNLAEMNLDMALRIKTLEAYINGLMVARETLQKLGVEV